MTLDFSGFSQWVPLLVFTGSVLGGFWKVSTSLTNSIKDLNYEIKMLRNDLNDGKIDRQKIKSRLEVNNSKIETQNTRLSLLEDWRRECTRKNGYTHERGE